MTPSTVRRLLLADGLDPAPRRSGPNRRDFLRQQVASVTACDFFTVETLMLRRFYVLFFIELGNRRVHLAGCTTNPTGPWVTQQARNLSFSGMFERMRFLIHDSDSKFTAAFDEVFRSEGIKVIHTPIRALQANGYAERFVRMVRAECLDWLLIFGPWVATGCGSACWAGAAQSLIERDSTESRGPGIELEPFVPNFSEQERDGRAVARR